MERTNKKANTNPVADQALELPRWKKLGGGSLRLKIQGRERFIKPNEIFKASVAEIPEAFRDVIVPMDGVEETPEKVMKGKTPVYSLRPIEKEDEEAEQLFDIVDDNGKKLNEEPLSKERAESLINDLN